MVSNVNADFWYIYAYVFIGFASHVRELVNIRLFGMQLLPAQPDKEAEGVQVSQPVPSLNYMYDWADLSMTSLFSFCPNF